MLHLQSTECGLHGINGKRLMDPQRIIDAVHDSPFIFMKGAFSADPRVTQSLRHSVRDGIAYSVMSGVGETYLAAYALFLGATAAQVSLLAAIPPLFGAITQLFAAWLEGRAGTRRALIVSSALMHAFTWFPIIWLPYFVPSYAVPIMVGCIVAYHGWIGFGAPLWCTLMADLVPARKRGRFFGGRTRLMSVTSFAALVVGGVVLEFFEARDDTRLGFAAIFTAAAAARMYSVYHLARMAEPNPPDRDRRPLSPPPTSDYHGRFVRFSLFIAAMNFAVAVAGPFFTVYMLRDLHFSYLQFTAATAIAVVAQFLTLRGWGRFADLFGNRAIMAASGLIVPLVPALWLLSPSFGWVLLVQAIAGWSWAGFSLAAGNHLYDVVRPYRRAASWATHNLLNNVGTCAGALMGGATSAWFSPTFTLLGHTLHWSSGLWVLMLASAILRALALAIFLPRVEEVRPVPAFSARALVFRMVRSNQLAGFVLDRTGLGRRRPRPPRTRRSQTGLS